MWDFKVVFNDSLVTSLDIPSNEDSRGCHLLREEIDWTIPYICTCSIEFWSQDLLGLGNRTQQRLVLHK